MSSKAALILFAREPRPGGVKTRLVPRLGPEGAAALYAAFLEDAGRLYLWPERWTSVLCADPGPEGPALRRLFPPPWRSTIQAPGDLGERLTAAFDEAFNAGALRAVVVGSDHPALALSAVEGLFDALRSGSRAALVPAEDGGYCAIGLEAGVPLASVFRGIPWSSPQVLAESRERLERAGIPHCVLPPSYDVDEPEDLDRLRKDLARRDPLAADFPSATAEALRLLDRVSA